ncbi:MAG: hypothetical protein IH616_13460 [Gemmatimonadales bacterium]|jgi:hypothetical protein|nr:hypothetical protein [Gemmatimonadales bacterium]
MPDQETMQEIFSAVRSAMGRGFSFGGGGGRGGAPVVSTGDYLVSITVNGSTMSRVLRVERVNGGGGSGFGFEEFDR